MTPPSHMPATTIGTGVVCILLGIGLSLGAIQHGSSWVTAAIPAYVGVIFVALGALAISPKLRMHAMHLAALLALLLVLGGFGMGLPKLIAYQRGTLPIGAAVRPLAWWGQVSLAGIMLAFLVIAIQSFIAARRWRKNQPGFEVV